MCHVCTDTINIVYESMENKGETGKWDTGWGLTERKGEV